MDFIVKELIVISVHVSVHIARRYTGMSGTPISRWVDGRTGKRRKKEEQVEKCSTRKFRTAAVE